MENIGWGLYMTVSGMGSVFLLLAVLMMLLLGIGRLDQPKPAAVEGSEDVILREVAESSPESMDATITLDANGLSPEQVVAITVAVAAHAKTRRGQAAQDARRVAPDSQLHASRWVAIGRAYQNQPWK